MSINKGWFAALVAAWGLVAALLLRGQGTAPCPLGSCPACGACLRPPAVETTTSEDAVA